MVDVPGKPWPYPAEPIPRVEPSFRGVMDTNGAALLLLSLPLAVLGDEDEEDEEDEGVGSANESSARGDRGRAEAGVTLLAAAAAAASAAIESCLSLLVMRRWWGAFCRMKGCTRESRAEMRS